MTQLTDFLQGVCGLETEELEHPYNDGLREVITNMAPHDLTALARVVERVQARAYSKAYEDAESLERGTKLVTVLVTGERTLTLSTSDTKLLRAALHAAKHAWAADTGPFPKQARDAAELEERIEDWLDGQEGK
jgi:hypothetical protein